MDTAKRVNSGQIERTLDRNTIWMAQTPQAFDLNLIRTAHEKARLDRFMGTDDAMLVERLGTKDPDHSGFPAEHENYNSRGSGSGRGDN